MSRGVTLRGVSHASFLRRIGEKSSEEESNPVR